MCIPYLGLKVIQSKKLDREILQQSVYTWQKLTRRFPRALPEIVDDRDRWVKGVSQILDLLKNAIHKDEPLPASLLEITGGFSPKVVNSAGLLINQHPVMGPLINALSWCTFLNPEEMAKALTWFIQNITKIENLFVTKPGKLDKVVDRG